MKKSFHNNFSQFLPRGLDFLPNKNKSKSCPNTLSTVFAEAAKISCGGVVFVVLSVALIGAAGYNDEKGIFKWTPRWFANNFRYSAPTSYYISPNRIGTPFKRLSESAHPSDRMYKWSPLFFSGESGNVGNSGSYQPTSWYGGGMYSSSSRPRWSPISSYSSTGGGNRHLTRYYVENSPPTIPKSIMDLGSNDLSALLGEEMNGGLGLENDAIDVLDGNTGTNAQQRK